MPCARLAALAMSLTLLAGCGNGNADAACVEDADGGAALVYEARALSPDEPVTPALLQRTIERVCKRLERLELTGAELRGSGGRIVADVPGRADRGALDIVFSRGAVTFYDWEPNVVNPDTSEVLGPNRAVTPEGFEVTSRPVVGSTALYEATKAAAKTEPVAEETDIPPGGPDRRRLRDAGVDPADEEAVRELYDRQNDSSSERFYLFAQNRQPIYGAGAPATPQRAREQVYAPSGSCEELLIEYADRAPPQGRRGEPREYAEGTACEQELGELGSAGPPAGSEIVRVPKGIVVVEAERAPNAPDNAPRSYFILEDDSELDDSDIRNPEQNTDPQTNLPIVTMEFSDEGREAFATVTRRIAERGSTVVPPPPDLELAFQRFVIMLDDRIVSLATINFRTDPEGIDGRTGAQITNIGNLEDTQSLAAALEVHPLPVRLARVVE